MRKIMLVLALAIACASTNATEASDLLSLIISQLSEPGVVHADFVQEKNMAVLSRPIISRGRVVVSRRDGLIWQVNAPLRMSIAFSETRVIEIDAEGKRHVISGNDNRIQAEVGRVLRGLLAADKEILNRYFTLKAEGDVHYWRMDLMPRSAELERFIKKLHLTGGQAIDTIRVEESNGDTTLIRLQNTVTADSLSSDEQALLDAP